MPEKKNTIGRFEIVEKIGEGPIGAVYKALDPVIRRTVAIKVIKLYALEETTTFAEVFEKIYRVVRTSTSLNHPNICIIYDLSEEKKIPYVTMEYVEGHDLDSLLQQKHQFKRAELMKILQQTCDALDFAHKKNVIHQDLKATNILLTPDLNVKITDFGLAGLDEIAAAQTKKLLSIPYYISPEQALGDKVSTSSDLFSLGSIIYQLLSGQLPFPGTSAANVIMMIAKEKPAPPKELQKSGITRESWDAFFNKALAKSPNDRFRSAREIFDAVNQLVPASPQTYYPYPYSGSVDSTGKFEKTFVSEPLPGTPAAPTFILKKPDEQPTEQTRRPTRATPAPTIPVPPPTSEMDAPTISGKVDDFGAPTVEVKAGQAPINESQESPPTEMIKAPVRGSEDVFKPQIDTEEMFSSVIDEIEQEEPLAHLDDTMESLSRQLDEVEALAAQGHAIEPQQEHYESEESFSPPTDTAEVAVPFLEPEDNVAPGVMDTSEISAQSIFQNEPPAPVREAEEEAAPPTELLKAPSIPPAPATIITQKPPEVVENDSDWEEPAAATIIQRSPVEFQQPAPVEEEEEPAPTVNQRAPQMEEEPPATVIQRAPSYVEEEPAATIIQRAPVEAKPEAEEQQEPAAKVIHGAPPVIDEPPPTTMIPVPSRDFGEPAGVTMFQDQRPPMEPEVESPGATIIQEHPMAAKVEDDAPGTEMIPVPKPGAAKTLITETPAVFQSPPTEMMKAPVFAAREEDNGSGSASSAPTEMMRVPVIPPAPAGYTPPVSTERPTMPPQPPPARPTLRTPVTPTPPPDLPPAQPVAQTHTGAIKARQAGAPNMKRYMIAAMLIALFIFLVGGSIYYFRKPHTNQQTQTPQPQEQAAPVENIPVENQPVPPAATTGKLSVTSEPAGATVSVDGVEKGTTPAEIADLPFGKHTLLLKLKGFDDAQQEVELNAQTPTSSAPFTLTKTAPLVGTLVVESTPAGAFIVIGKQVVGVTPKTLPNTKIGKYDITLKKDGFQDFSNTVRIVKDKTVTMQAQMVEIPKPAPIVEAPKPQPAKIKPGTLVTLGEKGVIPPRAVKKSYAKYPEAAKQKKIQGVVSLNLLISETGKVLEVKVTQSANPILDEAAIRAVHDWLYEPATKDGVPVKIWIPLSISFQSSR